MDDDLESMAREQLVAEVKRLRGGIRQHRDSTGHDLCWHHPALWGLLPERPILFLRFHRGLSSWQGASGTAGRSTRNPAEKDRLALD
jgi:hypothetical protein